MVGGSDMALLVAASLMALACVITGEAWRDAMFMGL